MRLSRLFQPRLPASLGCPQGWQMISSTLQSWESMSKFTFTEFTISNSKSSQFHTQMPHNFTLRSLTVSANEDGVGFLQPIPADKDKESWVSNPAKFSHCFSILSSHMSLFRVLIPRATSWPCSASSPLDSISLVSVFSNCCKLYSPIRREQGDPDSCGQPSGHQLGQV